MNIGKIRNFTENRPGGLRKLASDIGMSPANLHRRLNANDLMASDLEKIARALGVSIIEFFDETVVSVHNEATASGAGSAATLSGNVAITNQTQVTDAENIRILSEKVKFLELQIQEKDARIADLKDTISMLRP